MPRPRIYLDNNSTTPIAPEVKQAIVDYFSRGQSNPSSVHYEGQDARGILNLARSTVAKYFSAKPEDITFNSGATEGLHMLIRGVADTHPKGHIISSTQEHACVYELLKHYEKTGTPVSWLKPNIQGEIDPEELEKAIKPETKLIILMAVNNETGIKYSLEAFAAIAVKFKIPFIVDGVALLGKETFTIPPGVSAVAFSGHKLHAPAGTGFIVLKPPFKVPPMLIGGPQEFGRRAGTENLMGIIGLSKAIELLNTALPQAAVKMSSLRNQLEEGLKSQLKGVAVNGEGLRICNVSNLAFEGVDGESLLMNLDQAGIAVSHGSACSSGALEPSRVLLQMGLPYSLARSSIRFSLSRYNTSEEIYEVIGCVVSIVNKLRSYSS